MENICKVLKILRKNLEIDQDMRIPNNILIGHENTFGSFQKLDFPLGNWKYPKILENF
jgi:hypothetical protein